MKRYQDFISDVNGRPLAGVNVTVYLTGTTNLATLYSDNGVTPTTNPVNSDADGFYYFYVADGVYDLAFSGPGLADWAKYGEEIFSDATAVVYAHNFPGSDAFAKINAAIAALPDTGGTVDARGFGTGTFPVSTQLIVGSITKPVTLLVDNSSKFEITLTGGIDAIQLWNKSSIVSENQTHALDATFALTAACNVNTILSTYPRSSAGNLTYLQGISFKGATGATVASALVELYNPSNITTVRNCLIWNFFGVGLLISGNAGCGGEGPLNLENLTVDGGGNAGAQDVLIQCADTAGVIVGVNFYGGSFTHPGPGGLPIIKLEGGSTSGVENVNFYGCQFESANSGDIGILVSNARAINIIGSSFTAQGGHSGADCVKIQQSVGWSLNIVVQNLVNYNAWTNSINDTVNAVTVTQSRVPSYVMAPSEAPIQTWVGAYDTLGKIAEMLKTGLVMQKPVTFLGGGMILGGSADPSAGAGVVAPMGSLYLRSTGAAGSLYLKTGPGDTNWTAK